MRKRICFGFGPLLCLVVCLLNHAPADTSAGAGGCCAGEKKGAKGPCEGMVCPLYKWGDFGTYCSYYAKKCMVPPQYVNLDHSDCKLAANDCMEPCTGCVDGGSWAVKKGEKDPGHHHEKKLRKGVMKKAPRDIKDILKGDTHLVGDPIYVFLVTTKDGKTKAKVMLYLVRTKPAPAGLEARPIRFFATGLEVDRKDDPTLTIPYTDIIQTRDKVCLVQSGSVTYQVVVDEKTTVDQLP